MIGIILSGHGNFATGVQSAFQLIAGKQEKFEAVDFEEGMSSESLHQRLQEKISKIGIGNEIVIFTDIPGGTPFNQSVMLSAENKNIKVIAGTNLPILLDGLFKRELPLEEYVLSVLEAGKNGVVTFGEKMEEKTVEEDGI